MKDEAKSRLHSNPLVAGNKSQFRKYYQRYRLKADNAVDVALRNVRSNPIIWTAVLAVIGSACFIAKSYHLGTVAIAAAGVLWMWQDMLDEAAATTPMLNGAPMQADAVTLLTLHR